MKLTFLGTGPCCGTIEERKGRFRSSLYIEDRDIKILVDCSPDFSEQVKKFNVNVIDFLILTHGHEDAVAGLPQLKKFLDGKKILAVMEKKTRDIVLNKFKDVTDYLEIRLMSPNVAFKIRDIDIVPFRVIHSIQPGFPTVGLKLNNIIYAEDMEALAHAKDKELFKRSNIIIIDAAMWLGKHIKGHMNVKDALEFALEFSPKKLILTQAGRTYPEHNKAEVIIKKLWKEMGGSPDTDVMLAKDGMIIKTESLIRSTLKRNNNAICLPDSHCEMLMNNEKDLVVLNSELTSKIGKIFYLTSQQKCYGLARVNEIFKVKDFEELYDRHKISPEEKQKWWPNTNALYAYKIEVLRTFEPVMVKLSKNDIFTEILEFVQVEELIKDIHNYDPKQVNTNVLLDDFRIVNAWYATKRRGKKFKYSLEEIVNLAKLIYKELKKRGVQFHPEKMKSYSKELFNKISKSSVINIDLKDPNLLDNFDDFKIIDNFISVCGSVVDQRADHEPNDMDLHIRLSMDHAVTCPNCKREFVYNCNEYIKRAVEVRLWKMLNKNCPELLDKLHMIWGDPEGSHDTYVPLYDLVLKRILPIKRVEMRLLVDKQEKYLPQKPVSPAFHDVDELISHLKNYPYYVEEKVNGFHFIAIKSDNDVKVYTEDGKDMTKHLPTFVKEIKKLSSVNFSIDGELFIVENGVQKGRADLIKFVTQKEIPDDKNVHAKVWDITFYKRDLKNLALRVRKQYLKKLHFTDRIKEVRTKFCETEKEVRDAINSMSKIKYSEGAVVKEADSTYSPGKKISAWLKYRNYLYFNLHVLKVIKNEAGNYNYLVGVKASDKNIDESKVENGYLVLGKTFNTKLKANEGSNIEVQVEEVWRHESKDGTFYYSIHKPKVIGPAKGKVSTIKDLDDAVVSLGMVVIENKKTDKSEGGGHLKPEESIINFPKTVQADYKKNIGKRNKYIIHAHQIGKSIHFDIRHKVNDHLQGFTVFTTGDYPNFKNLKGEVKHFRGAVKEPQPTEWLRFEGVTEPGKIGALRSKQFGGVFTIISKGEYEVLEVDDHKIHIKYYPESGKINKKPIEEAKERNWPVWNPGENLINFNKTISYHIAHIGDKHIMLIDELKNVKSK